MRLLFFFLLIATLKLANAGTRETLYGTGYVYVFYGDGSDNVEWEEADFKCSWNNAGTLVMIKYSYMQVDVDELLDAWGEKETYIGMHDRYTEGYFHWTDGTKVSDYYQHWNSGEPNNHRTENCGCIKSPSMYWNDNDCDHNYGFICAKASSRKTALDNVEYIIGDQASDQKYDGSLQSARKRCSEQRYRLVEITTDRVITELKKNVKWDPAEKYWVGGSKRCLHSENCDGKLKYICEAFHSYDLKLSTDQKDFMESQSIKIDCTASGLPLPNVTWYKYNAAVPTEKGKGPYQISELGKSTLVIEMAALDDAGRYRCLASNRINNGTRKTKIYTDIRVHPSSLSRPELSNSKTRGLDAEGKSLPESESESAKTHECADMTMTYWMLPTIFALNIVIMLVLFVLACSKRSTPPKSTGNEFTNYAVYATSGNGKA